MYYEEKIIVFCLWDKMQNLEKLMIEAHFGKLK